MSCRILILKQFALNFQAAAAAAALQRHYCPWTCHT